MNQKKEHNNMKLKNQVIREEKLELPKCWVKNKKKILDFKKIRQNQIDKQHY